MVKLPDVQAFGERRIPQSSRPIASYNPGVVGDAIDAAGRRVQSALVDMQDSQSNLDASYAEANLLQRQIDITNSLKNDPDYSTYRSRYEKEMDKAAKESEAMISSPGARAAFGAKAKLAITRGLPGIIGLADTKRLDYTKTSGLANIDKNREAYLNAPDEATRARVVANTQQILASMRDAGAIDSEAAYTAGKQWVQDAAQARVEMLPPEDQIKILKPRPIDNSLLGQALKKYGFIKQHDVVQIVTPQEGKGYAETWAAGEVGDKENPRPKGIPLNKNGIQIFKPDKFTADDVAGEVLHLDPKANQVREEFIMTLSSEQKEYLKKQPDYTYGNVSDSKRMQNAADSVIRGYTVGQWPKEEIDKFLNPKQKGMLDDLKKYMVGNAGKSGGFDSAIQTVLANEGGYTPLDGSSGSPAKFGINQRAHPGVDVKNLTQEEAVKIYKKDYWDAYKIGDLKPEVQTIVLDGVANHWGGFKNKLVKAARDGASPEELIKMRRDEYSRLAKANPEKYAKSLLAWNARLDKVAGNDSVKTGTFVDYIPSDKRMELLRKAEATQGVYLREEAATIENAAKLGLQVPRENIEALATKARDLGMGGMSDKLLQYADVQGAASTFAQQGIKAQGKVLTLLKNDVESGKLDDVPLYEAYANIYKNKLELLKKDPWQYYAAHGTVRQPQPMNMMDANDVAAKIQQRRVDSALVDKIEEGAFTVPVLTSGEIDQLKNLYETGTPQQAATAISTIGQSLNQQERRSLAQAIAIKEPMVAAAVSLEPDIAKKLLEGAKTKGEVPESKVREKVNEQIGGMVFDAEASEALHNAVYAYYKKLALDVGDVAKEPNDDLITKAINDVVGEAATITPARAFSLSPGLIANTSKVFTYKDDNGEYVDDGRLEDIFAGITDDILKKANGELPYTGDLNYVTAEELLSKAQFRSYGDGLYTAFYPGLGGLVTRDGRPYVFDARKLEALQK